MVQFNFFHQIQIQTLSLNESMIISSKEKSNPLFSCVFPELNTTDLIWQRESNQRPKYVSKARKCTEFGQITLFYNC